MSAPTLQDAVDALARMGCKPKKSGDGYISFCPIHEADGQGHSPSLTLKAGDRQAVIVNCHAGCSGPDILKALGVNGTPNPSTSIVATYRYQDADGREVREKVRREPKDFRIRHRDTTGQWVYKAGDGPPVLYRLPELHAAIAEGRTIFVCEGEKDVDRLASLGLVATTNIEGAAQPEQKAKWRPEYTAQLAGAARVVLLPDNDPPGVAHMAAIAQQLRGKVGCCQTIALSVPAKGDVSDWLNDGHTVDELKALVRDEPESEPLPAGDDLDAEFIPVGSFIAAPPDSSYLVKGILPASGMGQVFGNSHAGKSFVLIDLACHLALGIEWHGYRVKKASVLYIAAEGVAGLKLRFRAWFQDHGIDPPPNLRIRTVPANLTALDATVALRERMNRLPYPPDAVFVDTMATNFGPGSENDAEDMNSAIAGLKTLMERGLLLSAHHTGHGDKTRSRGHSSLFAALDVELHVTQDDDRIIRVGHTKLRDGDRLETIAAFTLKKISLPWADVDGDPLNSAVLEKCDAPESSASAKSLPPAQRIALEALRKALVDHGVEAAGVVSVAEDQWRQVAYDGGISTGESRAKRLAFQRAQKELVAAKKVSCHDGRYWIPSPRASKAGQQAEAPANLVRCKKCSGSGNVGYGPHDGRCYECGGSGKVPESLHELDPEPNATDSGTKRNKAEQCSPCSTGSGDGEAEQSGTSSFKGCSDVPPPAPTGTEPDNKPEIPAASSVETSPLARRILATLEQTPSGLTLRDLATATGNPGRGVSEAMVKSTCDTLLLAGKVDFRDNRYFLAGSAQR